MSVPSVLHLYCTPDSLSPVVLLVKIELIDSGDMAITEIETETDNAPHLPEDLERQIFEVAGFEWGPWDACKLLLVARRVRAWVRPLVYRVFMQTGQNKFPDLRSHRSPKLEDVAQYVKHLTVGQDTSPQDLERLLSSCTNLQNLLLGPSLEHANLHQAMPRIRLTRLSAVNPVEPECLLSPAFRNITHLDISPAVLSKFRGLANQWSALSHLPRLSHLLILQTDEFVDLRQCLEQCKALKTLIFFVLQLCRPTSGLSNWREFDDDRLVLMGSTGYKTYRWRRMLGVRGGIDLWQTADLYMTARKKNFLRKHQNYKWVIIMPSRYPSLDWDVMLNDAGKRWFSTLSLPSMAREPTDVFEDFAID